jgi:CRP-like cAMP-binding protein
MSPKLDSNKKRNRLLNALGKDDAAALRPHLESFELVRGKTLESPNKKIEYVYFPNNGMASVVGRGTKPDKDVEVGIVGFEGMTGLPVIFGNHRSPHHTFIQIAGDASRIPAVKLRSVIDERRTLQQFLLKYAQAFMIQTTHTAIANARGSLEQRLARWMVMAQDRTTTENIPLTHEFLSLMLAVRRPGVTEAVNELVRKGLIKHERGVLVVNDRDGLIECANGLYGVPELEYKRLLG